MQYLGTTFKVMTWQETISCIHLNYKGLSSAVRKLADESPRGKTSRHSIHYFLLCHHFQIDSCFVWFEHFQSSSVHTLFLGVSNLKCSCLPVVSRSRLLPPFHFYMMTSSVGEVGHLPMMSSYKNEARKQSATRD